VKLLLLLVLVVFNMSPFYGESERIGPRTNLQPNKEASQYRHTDLSLSLLKKNTGSTDHKCRGTYCAKLERMTERVPSLSSNQSRDNIRRFPCRERNSKNSAGHGHPFCSTSKACWAKKRPASRPMHDADEGGPVGAWDLWSPSPSPSSCRVPITNYASSSCSRVKSVQVRLCQTKERGRPSLAPPSPFRCAEWQQ
jgi:hypothetical protein